MRVLVWRGFGSVNFSTSAVLRQLSGSLHQHPWDLGFLVGPTRRQESDSVILVGLFQFGIFCDSVTVGKQRLRPAVGSHPSAEHTGRSSPPRNAVSWLHMKIQEEKQKKVV